MKKMIKYLLIVLALFMSITLTSCAKNNSGSSDIVSVYAKEVSIDDFDNDNLEVTFVSSNKKETNVALKDLNVSDEDINSLFTKGLHEISVHYNGNEYKVTICILASSSEIISPTNDLYIISETHYEKGTLKTYFYVRGNSSAQYNSFAFGMDVLSNVNKDSVEIVKDSKVSEKLDVNYDKTNNLVYVNYVNGEYGPVNQLLFTINYDSTSLYNNYQLNTSISRGFYVYDGSNVVEVSETRFVIKF